MEAMFNPIAHKSTFFSRVAFEKALEEFQKSDVAKHIDIYDALTSDSFDELYMLKSEITGDSPLAQAYLHLRQNPLFQELREKCASHADLSLATTPVVNRLVRKLEEIIKQEDGEEKEQLLFEFELEAAPALSKTIQNVKCVLHLGGYGLGVSTAIKIKIESTYINAETLKKILDTIGRDNFGGEIVANTTHEVRIREGVTVGDDLTRVLPSELALLGSEFEDYFYMKLIEKNLLIYDYVTDKEYERVHKGAMIVLLDSSSSMNHRRYQIASNIAFAIQTLAQKENRSCAVVMFADDIKCTLEFDPTFYNARFKGGTNYYLAFETAKEIYQENPDMLKNADVIMISDGEWDDEVEQIQRDLKEMGSRLHAFIVNEWAIINPKVVPLNKFKEFCNKIYIVDQYGDMESVD